MADSSGTLFWLLIGVKNYFVPASKQLNFFRLPLPLVSNNNPIFPVFHSNPYPLQKFHGHKRHTLRHHYPALLLPQLTHSIRNHPDLPHFPPSMNINTIPHKESERRD